MRKIWCQDKILIKPTKPRVYKITTWFYDGSHYDEEVLESELVERIDPFTGYGIWKDRFDL